MAGVITLTQVEKPHVFGDHYRTVWTGALDNSYVTGGYSVKNTDLGFASTVDPGFLVEIFDTNGYGARYDYVNQKIILYGAAGTQVVSTTDTSGVTLMRIVAYGKYRG